MRLSLLPTVAWAAIRSGAVVLLLLIYCLVCFPLFARVLCLSLFCYELLCVHSRFAIILRGRAGCFGIVDLQMCCCCGCSVALLRGAV